MWEVKSRSRLIHGIFGRNPSLILINVSVANFVKYGSSFYRLITNRNRLFFFRRESIKGNFYSLDHFPTSLTWKYVTWVISCLAWKYTCFRGFFKCNKRQQQRSHLSMVSGLWKKIWFSSLKMRPRKSSSLRGAWLTRNGLIFRENKVFFFGLFSFFFKSCYKLLQWWHQIGKIAKWLFNLLPTAVI